MNKLITLSLALGASALMMMQAAHAECIGVRFENDTGKTIQYLYVSPSALDRWGDDVLGSDILSPGDSEVISTCFYSDDDNYDFKAVFNDGTYEEWRAGVKIVGAGSVWVDRRFVLHSR